MRAAEVVGTFDEEAFQCRFEGKENGGPLEVTMTPLGHLCVPLLGTYLQEYDPVIPTVLLQTTYRPDKVPEAVARALEGDENVALFVQVHGVAPRNPCQHFTCSNVDELSVVLHAFLFPEVGFGVARNFFKAPAVGLFEPVNVDEVHQNPKDVPGSGVRFGALEPRDCIIHDEGAYSPSNCQVLRRPASKCFAFWIVARDRPREGQGQPRSVASFHYVCGDEEGERHMRAVARRAATVEELAAIDEALLGPVLSRIRR